MRIDMAPPLMAVFNLWLKVKRRENVTTARFQPLWDSYLNLISVKYSFLIFSHNFPALTNLNMYNITPGV